jgi:hypothetical protein
MAENSQFKTLNPADYATEATVSPKTSADIAQSGASTASSAATAKRTEAMTPLETEKLRQDIIKLQLDNVEAARMAKEGPRKTVAERKEEQVLQANITATRNAINFLMRNFNNELSGQGIIKSTLEYFPSSKKKAINTKSDGLSALGLSLFRVPGTGTETDADARRFVKANQPSTFDNDYEFVGKLYNLINRVDARVAQMGLPPIQWEQPKDVVMQQFFALPEEDRAAIGMPAAVPAVAATQADAAAGAATQAAAAEQADTTTALPDNAAFAQAIPMSAASSDANKKSMPIPPEMQAKMQAWLAEHPRGTVGLKEYANIRRALDAEFGFRPDLPYEDDPRTIEYLKQYNDPKQPINVTIPPVTVDDTRNMIERAAGTAVMNPIGTAIATGASTAGLNVMDALLPEMAALREMNPKSAMIGDIVGSIGGNVALRRAGNFGLSKLLDRAPELEKYFTEGGRIADYTRDFAGDMTGDVIQGVTYGGAVEGDPGTGAVSAIGSNLLGRGLGGAGKFVLGGSKRSPEAQQLMDEYGIEDLTVGQQYGGFPMRLEDATTSIPGIGDIVNTRRGESILGLNEAAFRTVAGQPIGSGFSGSQTLKAMREKAYDDAVAGKTFDLNDPIFTQDMADAIAARNGLTDALKADFDVAVKRSLGETPTGRTGDITGEDYQQSMRALIGYANAAKKPGFEKDFRDALKGVRNALSEAVQRQDTEIVPGLKAADAMYRGEKVLEDAISRAKMDPTGLGPDVFTPGNLTQAVAASGRKFDGPMSLEEISQLAQNVIPSKLPDSGSGRRLAVTGLAAAGLGGLGGGTGGYDTENGFGDFGEDALYGAGYTLAPLAAIAALGSRPGQKALSKFLFDRPEFMKSAANLADLTGKYKYVPDRLVAPALMPVLMPEGQDDPVVASRADIAVAAQKAAETAAAQAAAEKAATAETAPAAKEVPLKGTVTDPRTGRLMELRGNRLFYTDTNEPADIDLDPLLSRSNPAGMRRGGTVQAFRNGGGVTLADLAQYYGMRR